MRLPIIALLAAAFLNAQAHRHELGLTLGRLPSQTVTGPTSRLEVGSGTGWQANYGIRLINGEKAALYGEVHFLASPLREVASANRLASRDFASLYVTPGLRVKFRPGSRVSPFVAAGGGYALYENSTARIDGQPNGAPRTIGRGAFQFGGGIDVPVWRFVALRAEVRDFYTGRPGYNVAAPGGQHNVVAGGGILLRFGGVE